MTTPTDHPDAEAPRNGVRDHPRLFKTVRILAGVTAALGLAILILAAQEIRQSRWGDALALLATAGAAGGFAVFAWRIDRRAPELSSQLMIGGIAAGAAATMIGDLLTGSWTVAAYMLLTAVYCATMFPRRDPSQRSDFAAIQSGQGMDERRVKIAWKAQATSNRLIALAAGLAAGATFLNSSFSGGARVWVPALAVYAVAVLLPMPLTWWYSRRM
jgi:hypothetical protein